MLRTLGPLFCCFWGADVAGGGEGGEKRGFLDQSPMYLGLVF